MEKLLLPSKIEYKDTENENESIVVISPCYYGYGTTLGNALRRVLLSSLPGAAVTSMKIKGVQQEFSTIDNVKEDVLEIGLNLKSLRLKCFSEEPVTLKLKAKGEKDVTAADFEKNSDVEIINKDLLIATLTDKKADFEMEITVNKGRGYVPTEEREDEEVEIGTILLDSVYSPVINVGIKVENVRVGEITDYDRLLLTVKTDGTITPQEALEQSARILIDHFQLFFEENQGESELEAKVEELKEEKEKENKEEEDKKED